MIGESRWMLGGPERHSGIVTIVGASTLELDGPLGEVDLERTPDGGWSYVALSCDRDERLGICAHRLDLCRIVRRRSRCTIPV